MASSTDYMTIGGAVITVDGAAIGFTNDGIEVERTLEIKDFEDGIPLQVQLRTPLREKVRVKFPMMEILDADKLALVSLNIPAETVAGGAVGAVDGDNQEFTFGTYANPTGWQAFQFISLPADDSVAAHTITLTALKNTAEDTTYTSEDDYFLDSANGICYRNPAGDITAGQTVRAVWSGTATASKRLRLGNNNPLTAREVTVVHTSPNTGDVLTVKLWKAYFDGRLNLSPKKTEYWSSDAECLGTPDAASHPTEPVGYIDLAPAA